MSKRERLLYGSILGMLGIAALVMFGAQVIGYLDLQRISTPGNPATGFFRTYADSGSTTVKCITSTGAVCTFASAGGSGVTLQTNGTNNGSQSTLNLAAGGGMTLTDNGTGTVTLVSTGSGILLQTNGTNNGSQATLNLAAGSGMSLNDNGSGTITLTSSGGGSTGHALGIAWGVAGGATLTTGQTQYVTVPFACVVAGWNIALDAGTATVGVWKVHAGPADWSGTTGTVNTSGTAVTWVSGATFPTDAAGRTVTINGVVYVIASVASTTSMTLASSAGTQPGVSLASPGTAVPTVTNSIVAGFAPQLSSGTFAGGGVGGWTGGIAGTSIVKNDILGLHIDAVATATAMSIVLECN